MEKRLFIGVIGGIIAGIIKDIPDALFHYGLKITSITFWDYSGIIALGRHPNGIAEFVYAIFYEVIFSIFIGVLFVYITTRFGAKRYLLWGGIYGALVWFAIRAGIVAFHITALTDGGVTTAAINSMDSIFYGVILGGIIRYLEKKEHA